MTYTASIELDIVSEQTEMLLVFADVELFVDDPSINFVLVDPAGSAGDNPIFRFTGGMRNLYELVCKYYSHDLRDVNDVFFDMLFDIREEATAD